MIVCRECGCTMNVGEYMVAHVCRVCKSNDCIYEAEKLNAGAVVRYMGQTEPLGEVVEDHDLYVMVRIPATKMQEEHIISVRGGLLVEVKEGEIDV